MNNALQQAAASFPAFTWHDGIAQDLRDDLLSIELRRQLLALGGQIVEQDGELRVARADADYMELFDSNHQKVDLAGLYDRVKGQTTFKALTAEGHKPADPAPAQPGQLPEPSTTNPAQLAARRAAQESLKDFQRGQQETAERAQRMAEVVRQPVPVFTGKHEPGNRSLNSRRQAAEQSLADFQRGQGQ